MIRIQFDSNHANDLIIINENVKCEHFEEVKDQFRTKFDTGTGPDVAVIDCIRNWWQNISVQS